jgi:hypothetical protein
MDELISLKEILHIIFVAFPTAYLTSELAFRKYKTEKWWDRKSECYCETIDALNQILVICDAYIDENVHGVVLRKADKDILEEQYKKSKEYCFKQINIGKLLMSDEAHNILMSLERELFVLEHDSDNCAIKESVREVVEGHLNSFVPIAKSDLGTCALFKG